MSICTVSSIHILYPDKIHNKKEAKSSLGKTFHYMPLPKNHPSQQRARVKKSIQNTKGSETKSMLIYEYLITEAL